MIVKLKKFKKELNKTDLIQYFTQPKKFELEDINQEVDISDIKKTINLLNNKDNIIDENNNKISLAQTDAIISPILHKSFSKIPSKFFLDRAFLQFLSLDLFQDYTWKRWTRFSKIDHIPSNAEQKSDFISKGYINVDHFIPPGAFKGLSSLHSISRLFWPAEILYDDNEGYDILKKAFYKQDVAVAIFQRQYSFNRELSKKLVKIFTKKGENGQDIFHRDKGKFSIRREVKKLNFYGSTMSLDHLDLDNLEDLLSLSK